MNTDLSQNQYAQMPLRPHLPTRATSPHLSEASPESSSGKHKGFFRKVLGGKDKAGDPLKNQPGSQRSLLEPSIPGTPGSGRSDAFHRRERDPSIATIDSSATIKPSSTATSSGGRKESKGILHSGKFTSSRRLRDNAQRDEERSQTGPAGKQNYWNLDTDLTSMEGIVSQPLDPSTFQINTAGLAQSFEREPWDVTPGGNLGPGAWDAPDSWAVKKVGDENMARLREIDEEGIAPKAEDSGVPHGLRVFRIDQTFATLSTGVNTTAEEILQLLGKKSFLQDDLNTYQIVMRKQDLQRQLAPGERPIAIQRRLLEQVGYTNDDHIEEIGREDNSYLCRFTFVPTKISGYYSLEKDPGLSKLSRYRDVDIQGRSLITIPISLYSKAAEINSLNISRNLALDVPKDFIQACTSLRILVFRGNEAWQLPPSFSLASKLTQLDVSNNRLEQLDHANLGELTQLVSFKAANNRLTSLPLSFNRFGSLRSLNVSSNNLTTLPNFIYGINSLRELDISFNAIEKIQPEIGQLRNLERLIASNNMLTDALPEEIRHLQNLKEVDLRNNGINSIDVFTTLPFLETLHIDTNGLVKFEGSFQSVRLLTAECNPVTRFHFTAPVPSLIMLDLSDGKLFELEESFFEMIPNVSRLNLDKNQLRALPNQIGAMRRLNYLSLCKNTLSTLPANIGCLQELETLDLHECNIRTLPAEIWCCTSLKTLNVASNILESFPKLTPTLQPPTMDTLSTIPSNSVPPSPAGEELGKLEDYDTRRPSHSSTGLLSVGSSPVNSTRKGSIASVFGPNGARQPSIARTNTGDGLTPIARKDSNINNRVTSTFAASLRALSLADNRLDDGVFDMITLLPQLRSLNLSYNELDDIPQNALRKWPNLQELYLSGNDLNSLPSDDLVRMDNHPLRVLHLNGNKFQVLPAELGKIKKLSVLDVGSNSLKYNVTNWKYDWNWNSNVNLRYLNFSGNKRLEIKPQSSSLAPGQYVEVQDLTNFNRLNSLRILGLMDVTLTIPSVPDQTDDRRVRSSVTNIGSLTYGMADTLGKNEHLSIIDMLVEKFRGHDAEVLLGMFDGQSMTSSGSKIAKYLAENFGRQFGEELSRLKGTDTTIDALRRTFLSLDKDIGGVAVDNWTDHTGRPPPQALHRASTAGQSLGADDVQSGGVATVLFLDNMELYVANVGDVETIMVQSDGRSKMLSVKHRPLNPMERQRIRDAGGFVARNGKVNDALEVSRAFGYVHMMPAVMASPSISRTTLTEQDEMIILASSELWKYLSHDVAVDVARSERGDVMRAAQKLRDLAISFGAGNKIMVMVLGISDLKKRERRNRGSALNIGPSQLGDDQLGPTKRGRRGRHETDDKTLERLDKEVDAPQGELSLVFTDIKGSTALWELNPTAMRAGIKTHNDLLRRQLRIIGGYEVKTEGDAFMVAFPTATSALLWCFSVQSLLLTAPWPPEIIDSEQGQEILDDDQNVIYRGLSVRMGIHWGAPVCETDPVTRRMDYFGPMVNRASRISSVADGGQITVSTDFVSEIHRTLEIYAEYDRSGSTGSEDTTMDDALAQSIRRDLRTLSTQGFEVKDLGERKLKGLENPEYIYLMYPHSLAARLTAQVEKAEKDPMQTLTGPASLAKDSKLKVEPDHVWDLWKLSLRLEMLCSALEDPQRKTLKAPETAIMERVKNRGGEISDDSLVQFMEHLITRVEVSFSATTTPSTITNTHLRLRLPICSCAMRFGHSLRQATS